MNLDSTDQSHEAMNRSSPQPGVPIPPAPLAFVRLLAASVVVCFLTEAVCRCILHLGYPYNWPLLFPDVSFMDFRWYFQHFHTLHTPAFFQGPDIIMYPAPVVTCYWFFYSFQPFATKIFLTLIVATSMAAAFMVLRALVRRGMRQGQAVFLIVGTYLFAYPFWFEFKQANMEIIVWVLLSVAFFSVFKRKYWAAALLIGVVGAMKLYPLVFLGLLISKKRYRECVFSLVVSGIVLLTSLWALGPTVPVAWHGTQAGLEVFRVQFMLILRPHEIGFDHSLFAVIKTALAIGKLSRLLPDVSVHTRSVLLSSYLTVMAVTGTTLYFVRIRKLPMANQVLCLTLASIMMPPVSYDYTLIHLYAPWTLLVFVALAAGTRGKSVRGLYAMFICMALAVAPLSELIFHHERFGGELRALILLVMFVLALRSPFALPEDDPATSDHECASVLHA